MFYGGRGKRGYLVANVKEHMAGICSFSACVCVCAIPNISIITRKEGKKKGRRLNMNKNFKIALLKL